VKALSKRKSKKRIAVLLILAGLSLVGMVAFDYLYGKWQTERLMKNFYEGIEDRGDDKDEEGEVPSEQASTEEKASRPSFEEGVIGIIEIESINVKYPIIEGADQEALNKGIGHLTETAMIGEKGNCVLCGHNGSRSGEFFTKLNMVAVGDLVRIMDERGDYHTYKVVNTRVVGPRENSIKDTDGTEKLTLFTCTEHGTKRYVCDCIPIKTNESSNKTKKGK
jgi:sortase A